MIRPAFVIAALAAIALPARAEDRFVLLNCKATVERASKDANAASEAVANNIKGALAIPHPYGRLQFGADLDLHFRTLIGAGCNPNVAAVVVIGIEEQWTKRIVDGIATTGKPVTGFGIELHGDHDTIMRASKAAREYVQYASEQQRSECPLEDLWVSCKCGESDTTMVLIVGAQELFHRPPRPLQNPGKQRRHRPSYIDPLLDGCANLRDERPFRMLRGERKRRWRFLTQLRQAALDECPEDPRIMSCTKIQAPPFSAALRFFRILVNEAHQIGCLTDFRIGPARVGRELIVNPRRPH